MKKARGKINQRKGEKASLRTYTRKRRKEIWKEKKERERKRIGRIRKRMTKALVRVPDNAAPLRVIYRV